MPKSFSNATLSANDMALWHPALLVAVQVPTAVNRGFQQPQNNDLCTEATQRHSFTSHLKNTHFCSQGQSCDKIKWWLDTPGCFLWGNTTQHWGTELHHCALSLLRPGTLAIIYTHRHSFKEENRAKTSSLFYEHKTFHRQYPSSSRKRNWTWVTYLMTECFKNTRLLPSSRWSTELITGAGQTWQHFYCLNRNLHTWMNTWKYWPNAPKHLIQRCVIEGNPDLWNIHKFSPYYFLKKEYTCNSTLYRAQPFQKVYRSVLQTADA